MVFLFSTKKSFLLDSRISSTNAKNHFGYVVRIGGVRYFGTTKSSDFVYFDGSEYFVTFNV
jgi:hypothetical protein